MNNEFILKEYKKLIIITEILESDFNIHKLDEQLTFEHAEYDGLNPDLWLYIQSLIKIKHQINTNVNELMNNLDFFKQSPDYQHRIVSHYIRQSLFDIKPTWFGFKIFTDIIKSFIKINHVSLNDLRLLSTLEIGDKCFLTSNIYPKKILKVTFLGTISPSKEYNYIRVKFHLYSMNDIVSQETTNHSKLLILPSNEIKTIEIAK